MSTVVVEEPRLRHVIATLTHGKGDSEFTWDPSSPDDVSAAEKHFDELNRTHVMYHIGKDGEREQLSKFNPHVGRVLAVPPLVAG